MKRKRNWNRTRFPNREIRPVVLATGFELNDIEQVKEVDRNRLAITFDGPLSHVIVSVLLPTNEDREEEICS